MLIFRRASHWEVSQENAELEGGETGRREGRGNFDWHITTYIHTYIENSKLNHRTEQMNSPDFYIVFHPNDTQFIFVSVHIPMKPFLRQTFWVQNKPHQHKRIWILSCSLPDHRVRKQKSTVGETTEIHGDGAIASWMTSGKPKRTMQHSQYHSSPEPLGYSQDGLKKTMESSECF